MNHILDLDLYELLVFTDRNAKGRARFARKVVSVLNRSDLLAS